MNEGLRVVFTSFSLLPRVLAGPALVLLFAVLASAARGAGPVFQTLTNVDGWSFDTGAPVVTSPAVGTNGDIYVVSGSRLKAVSPAGVLLWNVPVLGAVRCSPTVGNNGQIYVATTKGFIQAFRPDGTNLWNAKFRESIRSTPAIGDDGSVYFGCDDNQIYSLYSTGRLHWAYRTRADAFSAPSLGLNDDVWFTGNDFDFYRISSAGALLARFHSGNNFVGSPAVGSDGTAYGGSTDNKLYALSANTSGTNVAPKWRFASGRDFRASPSIANDGTLYMIGMSRQLYAFQSTDGKPLWALPVGRSLWAGPAIGADGNLYFGTSDKRVQVVSATGQMVTNHLLGGAIRGTPVIDRDGTVYVGAIDRRLYALRIATQASQHPWPVTRGDARHTARARFGPLQIVASPTNTTVRWGAAASLSVSAGGTDPLAYQWYFNNAPLPGRTSPVLTISNVTGSEAGNYFAVVTNESGAVTSRVATVTVNPVPYVVQVPTNLTINFGETGVVAVVANGAPELNYRWRFHGSNLPLARTLTVTNATLVLTNVVAADGGPYSVVVSNDFGSVTSSVVTITVAGAPVITQQPTNYTTVSGLPASFTVVASGLAPLTYQWRLRGTNLPGGTNATLTIAPTFPFHSGNYDCVITNVAGSVTSAVARLLLTQGPPFPGGARVPPAVLRPAARRLLAGAAAPVAPVAPVVPEPMALPGNGPAGGVVGRSAGGGSRLGDAGAAVTRRWDCT